MGDAEGSNDPVFGLLDRRGLDARQAQLILLLPATALVGALVPALLVGFGCARLIHGAVGPVAGAIVGGLVLLIGWALAVCRVEQAVLLRPWPSLKSLCAMLVGPGGASVAALLAVKLDWRETDEFVVLFFAAFILLMFPPFFVYARANRARLLLLQMVPAWREQSREEVERSLEQMEARDAGVDAATRLGGG